MISSAVVHRYASALADVVLGPGSGVDPAQAVDQLRSFADAVASSPDLRSVLATPAIPVAKKRAVIKDVAARLGLAAIVRNVVLVINDHGRITALAQILSGFEEILDERLGFVRAEVQSAFELNDKQQGELADQLGRLAGKRVRLRFAVDLNLIGGVTAHIGSKVYDGSVRGQLADIRDRLIFLNR